MAVLDVRVRDLQAGDYLLGSRQTIVYKPFQSVKHPGKRVVSVRSASGSERIAVWNPNTTMRINRPEPVEDDGPESLKELLSF